MNWWFSDAADKTVVVATDEYGHKCVTVYVGERDAGGEGGSCRRDVVRDTP